MSIISCLSSIVQLILLLLPVPKSIMMCLFLKHTHRHHEVLTPKLHINHCVGGVLPEKEHDGAGVVQLVHLVEVWHFCDVHQVNNSEIFHLSNTDYMLISVKNLTILLRLFKAERIAPFQQCCRELRPFSCMLGPSRARSGSQ